MTKSCKCNLLDTTENDRFCVKEFRLYLIGLSLGHYNKIQRYKRTIAAISHVPEGQWLWCLVYTAHWEDYKRTIAAISHVPESQWLWCLVYTAHWEDYAGPTWANLPYLCSVWSWFWAALSLGWCCSTFISFLGPAVSPRIFFSGRQQTSKRARPPRSVVFGLLASCLLTSHCPSKSHT